MSNEIIYGGRCPGKSKAYREAIEQIRQQAVGNAKAQKTCDIMDAVITAATNVCQALKEAFPKKQFLPVRDRRPLKRIKKNQAKAMVAVKSYMGAIQIGTQASQPIQIGDRLGRFKEGGLVGYQGPEHIQLKDHPLIPLPDIPFFNDWDFRKELVRVRLAKRGIF